MINQYWNDTKHNKSDDTDQFSLLESDRQIIRDNIIEAVIHSEEAIR